MLCGRRPVSEGVILDRVYVVSEYHDETIRVELCGEAVEPLGEQEARNELKRLVRKVGVLHTIEMQEAVSMAHGVIESEISKGRRILARVEMGLFTRELRYVERPAAASFKPRLPKPLERFRVGRGGKTTADGE